ncbi:putative leucine-rich repeat domain, L domain-containing protein [Rosa chinensis]|uniref:Putative leucine-rich repeat domain, L domain-containing protein n=1 Tax=Rosa chinensis TaxID=74649 RepID=A0A2P6PKS7_ROSCH|nr:putative leucine-rich repeat domain, L domain-containing protein [Rosa chinensis]
MPYLEFLFLEGCIRLCEVDPGIEVLERLTVLNLKDCKNLVHFSSSVRGLKSLKVLNLSGCSKVNKLPNDVGLLESLEKLYLKDTGIRELPTSTRMLERLSLLNMEDCKHLVCLLSSVGGLKSLKDLNLSGCSKLDKLPDELGHVACLKKLDVSGSGIREVPSSIGLLKNLKELSLGGCKAQSPKSWSTIFNPFQLLLKRSCIPARLSLACLSNLRSLTYLNLSDCNLSEEAIPIDFGCLSLLRRLNLRKNQFVRLPESIGQLSRLENLQLDWCHKLRTLPELPSHVHVTLKNCISLDTMVNQIGECNSVLFASCVNCFKMVENESYKRVALSLLARYLKFRRWSSSVHFKHRTFDFIAPGNEIPEWYNHQSVGSLITVELHPGWFSKKWMGFAWCVVFRPLKPFPSSVEMNILCSLKINGQPLAGFGISFGFGEKCDQPKSDHIWFFYVHRDVRYPKQEWQDIYYELVLSFIPFCLGPPGICALASLQLKDVRIHKEIVQVKKCGVRMVYEEDAEEQSNVGTNTKRGPLHCDDEDDATSSSASQAHPKKLNYSTLTAEDPVEALIFMTRNMVNTFFFLVFG